MEKCKSGIFTPHCCAVCARWQEEYTVNEYNMPTVSAFGKCERYGEITLREQLCDDWERRK
jgi:hypothetical protein